MGVAEEGVGETQRVRQVGEGAPAQAVEAAGEAVKGAEEGTSLQVAGTAHKSTLGWKGFTLVRVSDTILSYDLLLSFFE